MDSVPSLLCVILDNLKAEELKRFKFNLWNGLPPGFERPINIPKSKMKEWDQVDIVDHMIELYGCKDSITITQHILRGPTMNQNALIEELEEELRKAGGIENLCQRGTSQMEVIREKHKVHLKEKVESLYQGLAEQGNEALLNDFYTELYITSGCTEEVNPEHEVRQMEAASKIKGSRESLIKCSDIFKPFHGKTIRSVLTKGIAGIGKTVTVKKFILDWAEGKANQDVYFTFLLPFRELNLIDCDEKSLLELLQDFYPEVMGIECSRFEYCNVLFIFDGLDESQLPLDFRNNKTLLSLNDKSSIDVLMTNLIKGNLLRDALLWITSRPAATNKIPPKYIDQFTEIRGFNDQQKDEYFRKNVHFFDHRVHDGNLADRIISHIKSSRSLYIMCHIPVFCWMAATVLRTMLLEPGCPQIPQTLTEMYTHFLLIQTRIKHEKYDGEHNTSQEEPSEADKEIILKLGKLAFAHLEKDNLIFSKKDLEECNIDIDTASLLSGVCTEIIRKEYGMYRQKMYSFVHLSIQEYLAALSVLHSHSDGNFNALSPDIRQKYSIKPTLPLTRGSFEEFDPEDLLQAACPNDCKYEDVHIVVRRLETNRGQCTIEGACVFTPLSGLLRNAVDRALESKNGHLDLFLRFLLGLSLECSQTPLRSLFTQSVDSSQTMKETADYIKRKIKDNPSPERTYNLLHCLSELRDNSLIEEVQSLLSSGSSPHGELTPDQCSALAYLLLMSEKELDVFDLKTYSAEEVGFPRLMPVIKFSRKALLDHCNLQESIDALALELHSANSNLVELDLSDSNIGDPEVELLCEGLKHVNCALQTLILSNCRFTERACETLASAVSSHDSKLKQLNVNDNKLGDSEARLLIDKLMNPSCKIVALGLACCGLTEEACETIASILDTQSSGLRELDLSRNDLGDSGVQHLCGGLRSQRCAIQTIRLACCGLTEESCKTLASILHAETTGLTELDLSQNDVGDSGVQHLCHALRSQFCAIQTIRLAYCNLSGRCCADLASVLCCAHSKLRELELADNNLQNSGVAQLSNGLADQNCSLQKLGLSGCQVMQEGCVSLLSSVLSNPSQLEELNLSYMRPDDPRAELFSGLLGDPNCKLKKLLLDQETGCRWRPALLNYGIQLSFNINTVGKQLFLSEDSRTVTWDKREHSYPDHPERFTLTSQVLAQEPLSGRHYWEVEWSNRGCYVGVTYEGIGRKGNDDESKLGHTDKSWVLFCFGKTYQFLHNRSISAKLFIPVVSQRIGILLDWVEGSLSFYSVSKNTAFHIHTTRTTFTEPLYAGFYVGLDSSVSLCQL